MGFLILILLSYVVGLGILLKSILDVVAPGEDYIALLNSFMIYFFSRGISLSVFYPTASGNRTGKFASSSDREGEDYSNAVVEIIHFSA